MRIAQIAPLTEAVPPKLYGGTERVVSYLTEELVAQGHDVTLFASGDSITDAKLEAVWPTALRLDPRVKDSMALHQYMLEMVYRRAAEFDVLHFHLDYLPSSLFVRQDTPFVTTLHGRLDLPEAWPTYNLFPEVPLVSISNAQRTMAEVNWAATIHHGLPLDLLRPIAKEREYLAFMGRIAPEKRVDRAIRIAGALGKKLKIAAKIDNADKDYFHSEIKPLFELPHVDYVGELADAQKPDFLSGAEALLFPIDWPEPFGLVMIEAMACGTPVIAFDGGSVREVLEPGLTGFVVKSEAEAVAAYRHLGVLSHARIRARFEERFSARRMTEEYVALYARLARPRLRAAG